jgi:hypothetical protein
MVLKLLLHFLPFKYFHLPIVIYNYNKYSKKRDCARLSI